MMLLRTLVALVLAVAMGHRGYKKKSLDASGAIAAFCVGLCAMAAGYRFGSIYEPTARSRCPRQSSCSMPLCVV